MGSYVGLEMQLEYSTIRRAVRSYFNVRRPVVLSIIGTPRR